jgi:hypothetical protein
MIRLKPTRKFSITIKQRYLTYAHIGQKSMLIVLHRFVNS